MDYFSDKFDDPMMFAKLKSCVKIPTKTILFNIDSKSPLTKDKTAILRVFAKVLIIDEPLNNLDYVNAKYISNLINKVIRDNPQTGLLMISHCRIFPFITRELKVTSNRISGASEPYICHSCFGEPDENGVYK